MRSHTTASGVSYADQCGQAHAVGGWIHLAAFGADEEPQARRCGGRAKKRSPRGQECERGISLCTKPHGTGAFVSEVPFCLARKKERPQSRTAPRARVTNYEVVGERPSRSLSKITIIGADAPCLQRIRRSAKTERSYFTVPFPNMYIGPPSVQASFLRSDLYIQYLPRPFRRTASASLVLAIISDR